LHRKNKAAAHHLAVEPHGTGAADAVFAADMRSGQAEIVAQEIDQRLARRNARLHVLAVHAHVNVEVERIHAGAWEPQRPAYC
jgi:fructose-specific phosphotransferase system component IIB